MQSTTTTTTTTSTCTHTHLLTRATRSMTTAHGAVAAKYLWERGCEYQALRPLVLTLKSYLRRQGLNDVATGGLSSYGLTFMVLAHLQVKGGSLGVRACGRMVRLKGVGCCVMCIFSCSLKSDLHVNCCPA